MSRSQQATCALLDARPDAAPAEAGRPADRAGTLVEVIERWAAARAERPACSFLGTGRADDEHLTYAGLDARARAVAALIQARFGGAEETRGRRFLLLFPPGLDFVTGFLGCLYAGAVAVPVYPPASARHLPRLRSIVEDSRPHAVLTTRAIEARLERAEGDLPALRQLPRWTCDELDASSGEAFARLGTSPDELAFLQYTSGSTAAPKGVMVTHGNLLDNLRLIRRSFRLDETAVVVGWLPLYHDMGLIGDLLQPLFLGARSILMSPVAFLQRPSRWLRAVHDFGASVSGGPNFAYELCVERVSPAERRDLDLSGWRIAFTGSEPVRARTLERFTEAFGACGFRHDAFYPCYGMAEATLMVSGGDPALPPVVETRSGAALSRDRVAEPGEERDAVRLVGCGRSRRGQELLVVDPRSRRPCPAEAVGEIWLRGPCVARGYWGRPDLTDQTFRARLAGTEGPEYLRTGDLGYLSGGELFVTGRLKDLIIIRGRNHYPQDVEATVERSHPAVRIGCSAAFSVDVQGEERLVVVAEIHRPRSDDEPPAVVEAVRREVAEVHEIEVFEVVLARRGTVPKTSSGKIRRRPCRREYLAGGLETAYRGGRSTPPADDTSRTVTARASTEPLRSPALAAVLEAVAEVTGPATASPDPDRSFTSAGLDSLAAIRLQGEIQRRFGVEIELAVLLDGASPASLAQRLPAEPGQAPGAGTDAPPAPGDQPLTAGQSSLFFLHRLDPTSAAYHLAGAFHLAGPLERGALHRACQDLVDRHESLRATVVRAERLVARVWPPGTARAEWRFEDVAGGSVAAVEELLAGEVHRPFDLETGPLLRATLVRLGQDEHRLVIAVHHLAADGVSLSILLRELWQLYEARTRDREAFLPVLPSTFGSFARQQEKLRVSGGLEPHWEYWRRRVADPPVLQLPTDRPRPPMQTFRGSSRERFLPPDVADGFRALAERSGTTLYTAVLTGFQCFLARLTAQDDVVVGSPVTLRRWVEDEGVVGYFANPVPLRLDLGGGPGFAEVMERAREVVLGALAHRALPFPELVDRLGAAHDPARSPLFQAMFAWQRNLGPSDDLASLAVGEAVRRRIGDGLEVRSLPVCLQASQFDLTLTAAEVASGIRVSMRYNGDLFDATTIGRWLRQLETFLRSAAAEPRTPVRRLDWMPRAEIHLLLEELSVGPVVRAPQVPGEVNLLDVLGRTAQGDEVAVVAGSEALTYAELGRRSDGLAAMLAAHGLEAEEVVAVLLGRTADVVAAMFGIWKAGGVYLPLDERAPDARLLEMVVDSGARVLLAHRPPAWAPDGVRVTTPGAAASFRGASPPRRRPAPERLAYLLYTSGSTGRPKGVAVSHGVAAVQLAEVARCYGLAPGDRYLVSAAFTFDPSIDCIGAPLAAGATTVLAPAGPLAVGEFLDLLADRPLGVIHVTPSLWGELMAEVERRGAVTLGARPRLMVVGGEALPVSSVETWSRGPWRDSRVLNAYGPTEAAIVSSLFPVRRTGGGHRHVPIGRPVGRRRLYVLDHRGEPVPSGARGELWIAGEMLARGYHDDLAKTAVRFVPDAFAGRSAPGGRSYRTGDAVRFRADGRLEFLGRLDRQVKVRGHRVELGEIEATLRRLPEIRDAAVVLRTDAAGGGLLVAYVVPKAEAPGDDVAALGGKGLRRHLPEYMVPSACVTLDRLPLTASGKVDRPSLPPPPSTVRRSELVAPSTAVERALAEIWKDVLGSEQVSIHDDFFDSGGHSLQAIQVLARIHDAFGVDLSMRSLMASPTIFGLTRALAERLMAEAAEDAMDLEHERGGYP